MEHSPHRGSSHRPTGRPRRRRLRQEREPRPGDGADPGRLGISGYGFAPLRLPADLDFAPMFHGIDERVPVDSLRFGARVLGDFLRTC